MNRFTKSVASVMLGMSALTFFSCSDDDSNVIGLNDAAQYGKITVTLEGTRGDGVEFNTKKTFRFLPAGDASYSSVGYDGDAYFTVLRSISAVELGGESNNYAAIELQANTETNTAENAWFYLNTSIIDDDDNVYFDINDSFSVDMADVDNFNYSEGTGKLKFSFTTTLDGESNDTGNELTVTVDINVNVFEYVNGGFQGGDFKK